MHSDEDRKEEQVEEKNTLGPVTGKTTNWSKGANKQMT